MSCNQVAIGGVTENTTSVTRELRLGIVLEHSMSILDNKLVRIVMICYESGMNQSKDLDGKVLLFSFAGERSPIHTFETTVSYKFVTIVVFLSARINSYLA